MTGFSTWLASQVLTERLVTSPSWLALYTVAPADDGTGGTEVTGGSYARQQVTFTVTDQVASNTTDVVFSGMPGVTVVHAALWTASTGGQMLWHGPLDPSVTVQAGQTLRFGPGGVQVILE